MTDYNVLKDAICAILIVGAYWLGWRRHANHVRSIRHRRAAQYEETGEKKYYGDWLWSRDGDDDQ